MNKNIHAPYASPMCEVLEMISPEVLCTSNITIGGTTEGPNDLEDIFGGNN